MSIVDNIMKDIKTTYPIVRGNVEMLRVIQTTHDKIQKIITQHLSGVVEALEEAEKVLEMFVYYEDHRISLYPLKSVVDTAISKIKGE